MPRSQLDTLKPVLEALALCRSREVRERLLFEAVSGLELAQAVALWRALGPPGDGGLQGLREVLARGPAELLPGEHEVRAVLDGSLTIDLPDRCVIGSEGGRLAFAFGGLRGAEEAFDFVEAVLLVWAIVDEAGLHDALDTLPSPLAREALSSEGNRLAHDLRNLLQCVAGNAELLQAARAGEAPHDDALEELVERDVSRAAALLRQAFGRAPETPASTVGEQLEEICAGEGSCCRRSGIALTLTIDPKLREAAIPWSELQLERVLRNLIQNARHAILGARREAAGGTIQVAWEGGVDRDGRPTAHLFVRDDGPGVPPGFRPGFGLTSVQALSSSVGGRLGWENLPTGGAEFAVHLPLANAPPPPQ